MPELTADYAPPGLAIIWLGRWRGHGGIHVCLSAGAFRNLSSGRTESQWLRDIRSDFRWVILVAILVSALGTHSRIGTLKRRRPERARGSK